MADSAQIQRPDFVEVKASRNIFSKDFTRNKRIDLPIERDYPETNVRAGFAACFMAVMTFLVPAGLARVSVIFALIMAPLFAMGFIVFAIQFKCQRRLGFGRLIIDAHGFTDTRLSAQAIPWTAVAKTVRMIRPRSSRIDGIFLWRRTEATFPEPSADYRGAFFLYKKRREQLFIQLDAFPDSQDLADAIGALVARASGPANGPSISQG